MDDVIHIGMGIGEITAEKPVIKVIGVGGGGTNAANHMYDLGINNVDFVVCNTDNQSLLNSPVPTKIQLGMDGLGAGNAPEKGREAASYSLERIKDLLQDSTKMVFVTAGMGGGTGTGAAPLIAKTAKDMGILTIGIVTIPFKFEGKRRINQALKGVEEMRKCVDSILVISTERISKIYPDFTLEKAFAFADDILATAAKGIAEIITLPGYINVDLEDVKTVMTNSGSAVMGSAKASGKDRALSAIQNSLDSPLLLSTNLNGAKDILLNIAYGANGILVDELMTITDYLQDEVQFDENQIIWGATKDPKLQDDELCITIVATGFPESEIDAAIIGSKNDNAATYGGKIRTISLDDSHSDGRPNMNGGGQWQNGVPQSQPYGNPGQSYGQTYGNPAQSYGNPDLRQVGAQSYVSAPAANNPSDGLYSKYYDSPATQKMNKPTTETVESLPQQPIMFEDEDNDDGPISNLSSSSSSYESSRFSLTDENGLNDKNDFLHSNVD
ncbi:MAG: cell division protein FtsZ [Paludibacteraceae bacterium]|nr:cell division protein FtsZ [Paludibacteraceae bacterium]